MGATAKNAIGIMATAAAAMIVTPLTNKAKVASVNRNDTANDPARSRSPIAEASAMMNPITLLRWRCNIGDCILVNGYLLSIFSGRYRDEIVAKRASRRKSVG
jgi:hypothetical protein